MARREIVVLEDDLDGGRADETVTFGLDGALYEIDLSAENAAKLRSAVAAYVTGGRKVRPGATAKTKRGPGRAPRATRPADAWLTESPRDTPPGRKSAPEAAFSAALDQQETVVRQFAAKAATTRAPRKTAPRKAQR